MSSEFNGGWKKKREKKKRNAYVKRLIFKLWADLGRSCSIQLS